MLFDKVDFSGVNDKVKDAIKVGEQIFSDRLNSLKTQSLALAKAAEKTARLTADSAEEFAKGKTDADGVLFVLREGLNQVKHLAHAEGNLAAAATIGFLMDIGNLLLRFGLGVIPSIKIG